MSGMNGGIMESQQAQAAAGYAPPALPFASFPPAASVPGQVRRALDLNNAYLVSDGTYWNPLNGQAVIANSHNTNLTIQSLSEALITAVAFPAGFVRAGSRIRTWSRWSVPAVGTELRWNRLYMGAVGSGIKVSQQAYQLAHNLSSLVVQASLLNISTVISTNSPVRNNAISSPGLYISTNLDSNAPVVNFGAPWEISFSGTSCAETSKTAVTATWAAGVATFAKTGHGYATGDKVVNTLFDLGGYNGTLIVTGAPSTDTWTAAIAADPGGAGTGGSTSRISNVTLVDYLIEWLQ